MGADLIIHLDCPAKATLGDGDILDGTVAMLRMRKSSSQAMAVAAQLQESGIGLDVPCIRVILQTAEGEQERKVSVVDLLAEAAPLKGLEGDCAACLANVGNQPFGCLGYVHYPITPAAEAWLAARVQHADTLGGRLLCDALRDFGYTGEIFSTWRERGLIEASEPVSVVVDPEADPPVTVSTDQLFQAVFAVGNHLDPVHCALVLMWLGALELDGEVPGDLDMAPLETLIALDSPERRHYRSRLRIGDPAETADIHAMQQMLRFLYGAWVCGVGLLVDA